MIDVDPLTNRARKREHPNSLPFAASGFFALRTPLLPFSELMEWSHGLHAPAAQNDSMSLADALAVDRSALRQRLQRLLTRPAVREALFIASPSLDERLHVWLEQPDSQQGQKIERSLVKYLARMAGRATPFGLFAGCSVGTIGQQTRLTVPQSSMYRRHARLDMDYLVALAEKLEREPALRKTLRYRPNSSLYPVPGRVRYQEYRRTDEGRTRHAVSVEDSECLQVVLARAQAGATLRELADALLSNDPEATPGEAEEYLHELIDNQVLVSDLSPAVTGAEPIAGLVQQLQEHPAAVDVAGRLDQVRRDLAAINAEPLGVAPQRYRSIAQVMEELPVPVDPARLFQVDMTMPGGDLSLGQAVVEEIRCGVGILQRLARPPESEELTRFRRAFAERYQGQATPPFEARWLPLVEVLDEEIGIGFGAAPAGAGAALLDGLSFSVLVDTRVPWTKRDSFLLGKLSEALQKGEQQIVLEKDDLEAAAVPEPRPLPDAFAVMASVAAVSEKALHAGDFRIHLDSVSGPSGAVLLGRFCHADPLLRQRVEAHLRAEEALQPEAIFAEIVHLPEEGRIGNVLARPRLRDYEIVYLGQAGAPVDKQIPISDLLVTVAGDEILLRSQRLGRRVIPRLTSAHNFNGRGKGLYRFLCLLQEQKSAAPGWSWEPLQHAPFLPRVVCGKVVLARSRWLLSQKELKALAAARGAERFRQVQHLRGRIRWPRWVVLADGDNELPIDLDNVLSVEAFIELVKGRTQALVQEMFPGTDQLCAHGPEGRFVHELIVPFVRARSATAAREGETPAERATAGAARASPSVRRSFPPGSEWLYAKFYTGPALTDEVLRDVVRPVTEAVLRCGAASRWFFIRYADPAHHLRLRFHGVPERLLGEVFPALQRAAAPFVADGRVWRVQLDTYEREVERYGGPAGIELAEAIFQADSEAVLTLADLLVEDARGDLRWRLALAGMDAWLDDLGLDGEAKRALLRQLRESFAREFRADVNLHSQLGVKYRAERKNLEALLRSDGSADGLLARGLAAFRCRSESLAPMVAELWEREQAGRLALPLAELASSFLHMQANRLLRSGQRAQELVLYDLLYRHYESEAARMRGGEAARDRSAAAPPDLVMA